jgi:hypothetical protein
MFFFFSRCKTALGLEQTQVEYFSGVLEDAGEDASTQDGLYEAMGEMLVAYAVVPDDAQARDACNTLHELLHKGNAVVKQEVTKTLLAAPLVIAEQPVAINLESLKLPSAMDVGKNVSIS